MHPVRRRGCGTVHTQGIEKLAQGLWGRTSLPRSWCLRLMSVSRRVGKLMSNNRCSSAAICRRAVLTLLVACT